MLIDAVDLNETLVHVIVFYLIKLLFKSLLYYLFLNIREWERCQRGLVASLPISDGF